MFFQVDAHMYVLFDILPASSGHKKSDARSYSVDIFDIAGRLSSRSMIASAIFLFLLHLSRPSTSSDATKQPGPQPQLAHEFDHLTIHPPMLPLKVNGLLSSNVMLMVVGYRRELMEQHARTVGRHFHTVYMTEESLGHCVFCGDMDRGITYYQSSGWQVRGSQGPPWG
jgi:hypothetical protein